MAENLLMLLLPAFTSLVAWKALPVIQIKTMIFYLLITIFSFPFVDLLIDIADVIDIDVYTLGHNFMQIAKAFNLSIPSVGKFLLFLIVFFVCVCVCNILLFIF